MGKRHRVAARAHRLLDIQRKAHLRHILPSQHAGDARRGATADGICETVLRECFDTAILVFHDSGSETAAALRRIIPALAEQGYQFVTVSELIDITGNTNAVFTTKR